MCILSYLKPGVEVDEDGLLNGGLSNPDGHGWAITDTANDRIVVGKSMDLLEALDGFLAARKGLPREHALFHSRWATHGTLDTSNVHPFVAGHSALTVVAHNGILPREAHPAKGDSRSDTRKFADELLSTRYRRLNRERVRMALAGWITTANKLVILTVDPRYKHNAFLINSNQGVWDDDTGIWHSNYDFESAPKWLGKKGGYGYHNGYWQDPKGYEGAWPDAKTTVTQLRTKVAELAEADENDSCAYCTGHVNAGNVCTVCGTCQDCLEAQRDCLCFSRLVSERDEQREYDEWLNSSARAKQQHAYNAMDWDGGWDDDDMPIVST